MCERCFRIVYNNNYSSYEELLNIGSSFSIHHRNLQFLATEMIRIYTGGAPDILSEVFPLNPKSSNILRNQQKRLLQGLYIQYIMVQIC